MTADRLPDSAPTGLTWEEAERRAAMGEQNRVRMSAWSADRDILVRNLLTLFNLLVVPAAVALFLLGDWRAGWAVSGMAVVNTAISLIQELRAKRLLDQLTLLAEPEVTVLREGTSHSIAAGEVVRGDLLVLTAGEAVVADGPLLTAHYLEVDESLLTGESDPVAKMPGDILLSGSLCVAGRGMYRADRVGCEAFAQRLTIEARRYRHSLSPLQRELNRIIQWLTIVTIALTLVYVGLSLVGRISADDMWRMLAATVTSMVPQGLVLMTTLVLTLGAVRLSRQGAIVQRLSAVETMATLDTLCLDKTGTLTTGRLRLDRVVALGRGESEALRALGQFAWSTVDVNKTIEAIRADVDRCDADVEVTEQIAFRSRSRYSAVTLHVDQHEKTLILGAVEALLPFVSDKEELIEAWQRLLPTGLRLLLLVEMPGRISRRDEGFLSASLQPVALVALADEWRADAPKVLSDLAVQGIEFKIISGDHPETVWATVRPIRHLFPEAPPVTGDQLTAGDNRSELIRRTAVFGRVDPRQKLEIVRELQQQGRRVGMVGDGINDLLVLKQADLGIAMGTGTSAAKTLADFILADDDFRLLPLALREGRTIVHNVRKAAKLFLTKNVFTLLLILAGFTLLDHEFPYLPQQVTLLNALTIGIPAFLIIWDRPSGIVSRHSSLLAEAGPFAVIVGLAVGLSAIGVWVTAAGWGADSATRRSLLLTLLIICGLVHAVLISGCQKRVLLWCGIAIVIYLLVMYTPGLADFFVLIPLAIRQWVVVLGVAMAAVVPGLWLSLRAPS